MLPCVELATVAVPVPLGQAFTYRVPDLLVGRVARGARVFVEFGRRRVLGVVLEASDREPEVAVERLKAIAAVVDEEPVLGGELLSFLEELARYYIAPIGEVMRLALPAVERAQKESLDQQGFDLGDVDTVGRMVQAARAVPGELPPRLGEQARAIHQCLGRDGPTLVSELAERWPNARGALRRLVELGLAAVERRPAPDDPFELGLVARDRAPLLNTAQGAAVDAIRAGLEDAAARAFLLHGVTASGKTEVYLHVVERCLALGRGVIVLVPEIALTPQLAGRFRARLGDAVAVLHSGLTDRARHAMWKRLRSGEVKVAVGARSALFAPVKTLGLVCVDEEHDGSFKQDEGVRYHARDMALLRAHRTGAVCVLGSATPSIESEALVRAGKLTRLRLPARARASMLMPRVELVDLRRVGPGPSKERWLSLPLHRALERTLERGEQAILFLNRRGYAPALVCDSCGKLAECPGCSVALTLHRSRGERLICHYCGHSCVVPTRCPGCGAERLLLEGSGTERVEATLAATFPNSRIGRLDRDTGGGAKSERVLERMRAGAIDVLVGTQMVTKGHDLPRVTLVGVLNADAALGMPDFRAAERTFQLLVQVAGRAGRGDAPGTVMIQTRNPDHPAVALAARHDVERFVELELADRAELGYPPQSRLAMVRLDATDEQIACSEADRVAAIARQVSSPGLRVLGPAPSPLARLRGRYRYQLLLRAPTRASLRPALAAVARAEVRREVRLAIDVDPVSML
ncbi:MAG: primosomal protein N' [Polyangiaceae bacterium]|nr:primosomal protein N' [Polyangiaceae bacterium]